MLDSSLFAAAIADRRFWLAVAIAAGAGLVRGFSGFGSSLIYVPLVAAAYEPRVAAVTLLLIDTIGTAPFTMRAFAYCTWREVLPLLIAAAIAVPFGAMALTVLDPNTLRWLMAILVLGLLAILVSGWRYHGRPTLPVTIGVGLFSGLGGGAVQIGGPPVVIYWLSTNNSAITVRANFLVYFIFLDLVMCFVYGVRGLISGPLLALGLLLAIPYFAGTAAGGRLFRGASDVVYRRVAYAIIAAAALISLPLFDRLFK